MLIPVLAALFAQFAPDLRAQQDDPALVRIRLLHEMDARIDATAARAHIDARMMLDTVMPLAFLGMVAETDTAAGGLRITQIYRESAADQAGLRAGDVVFEFAGKPMAAKAELYREIRNHKPGETVDLHLRRDGQELVLHPTLGIKWEEDEEDEAQYGDITPEAFVSRGLPVRLDFENEALDATPASLQPILGGLGNLPRFVVVSDGEMRALRQAEADKTGIRFPIALVAGVDADDVVGRFRFRLVAGAQDRTAGIVLRYQDPANYLVARPNAVEGDLRIFRCVNGLRRTLPGAVADIHIDDSEWHTLEFRAEGPKITATLDDTITVTSYDTYFLHGAVGLWTKSDSITDFDDLSFTTPEP